MRGRDKWEEAGKKGNKEKEKKKKKVEPGLMEGFRAVDFPILVFVLFHKALRLELSELHLAATALLQQQPHPKQSHILDILRRYRFLHVAYDYHCAAEDTIIFRVLDSRVKNVACTYLLEHRSINELFSSVFHWLNILLEDDGNSAKPLQELAFCSRTIQTSICQHMLKEEEQAFPLLMQQFSFREQASLVWEFMCSVPIILLENFLAWLASHLSRDELEDVMHCIQEVVPEKEKILQEVVISWLMKKGPASAFGVHCVGSDEEVALCLEQSPSPKSPDVLGEKYRERESEILQASATKACSVELFNHPIDGFLCLWHGAIRKELKGILDELHEIRSSRIFSNVASVNGQITFLANVLIFYSEALDKAIFPVLNEHIGGYLPSLRQKIPMLDCQIEDLLDVLQSFDFQNGKTMCELLDKLFLKFKSLAESINQHFAFQESEVLPLICKHYSLAVQQSLLYRSLQMMPLGLLKYVITWLSAQLTEEESKSFLGSIKLAGTAVDMALSSLLHDWVSGGYSGKICLETFRTELLEMLDKRRSLSTNQIEEETNLGGVPCERPSQAKAACSDMRDMAETSYGLCFSPCDSLAFNSQGGGTSYSSRINLHTFFRGAIEQPFHLPKLLDQEAGTANENLECRPIDHIFQFHRALEHDLEYLDVESAKLAGNCEILPEFSRRFHLTCGLFRAHSDAEDEILFPALEAKGTLGNISHSYSIDHILEDEQFKDVSTVLDDISRLHASLSASSRADAIPSEEHLVKYRELCVVLHGMCKSMRITLHEHMCREECQLWPLFLEHFSEEEQEKIIGFIIGRTKAEILQTMIPWLMPSLTTEELNMMMGFWLKATKNTMFEEWLCEWWEGSKKDAESLVTKEQNIPPSGTADALEIVAEYLSNEGFGERIAAVGNLPDEQQSSFLERNAQASCLTAPVSDKKDDQSMILGGNSKKDCKHSQCREFSAENANQTLVDVTDMAEEPVKLSQVTRKFKHKEGIFTMKQEELEGAVRKVSQDTTLDPHKKSYLIQNLLMSPWIVSQQKLTRPEELLSARDSEELPGRSASYRDSSKLTFGCAHYKRNCKLLAMCCNQLFTCRFCHDDASDHSMDRKLTTKMMCMKCLHVQPVGPSCTGPSCNGFSMAKYFCSICKLFDDEREIYHCPFCNLCRVGKGLGIDYFHCMNCNACMSKALSEHICREKCFESNCPVCHEDIFTSSSPVKALSCGHLMHSKCFQDYTCTRYTCPICSKSLGDMQVYFGMLDALLAEEKNLQEFCGQNQDILCNDCEKRGVASFHWLYHKCTYCGSYNTRLL